MKQTIQNLVQQALENLIDDQVLPSSLMQENPPQIQIERTRDASHGDYACNIAMMLSKTARCKPRDLAEQLCAQLPQSDIVEKVDIAGPGFINFYLTSHALQSVVAEVLNKGLQYGCSEIGKGKKIQVEFVSANPTGPLHVGHGRGAAYGAALSSLLSAAGYQVHREYYVNDAGRQMDILATSVWLRYLELCGESIVFPSNGYKGDYVFDIAATLHRNNAEQFRHSTEVIFEGIPADVDDHGNGDKEAHIDGLIERAKHLLGAESYRCVFDEGLNSILEDIKRDLHDFGVEYEQWFSERSLTESGVVADAIEKLKSTDQVYENDGNWWFRSSEYGDEKDRVVMRRNGSYTYLASDIAYHLNKLQRGYDQIIDIWGADHHGYVARVKAAVEAFKEDPKKLEVLLVQFAILYRGKEKVPMSTRSGEFVTLRELRQEVGNDAARFFYALRKCEQHMDFDLELAKSQSNDNPVYYIQYAHARICSVMRQLKEKKYQYNQGIALNYLSLLSEKHEQQLLAAIAKYPEILESAALNHEPHQLAHYLRDLANGFHTYYNAHQFLVDDEALRNVRIALILATKQVFINCLNILGVSTPEAM